MGFIPKTCKKDCDNIIEYNKSVDGGKKKVIKKHSKSVDKDIGGGSNRLGRYRIPNKLIDELLSKCILYAPKRQNNWIE